MSTKHRANNHRPRPNPNSKGMTLIEIMIVIAIIGLIMGGLAFALMGRFVEAKDKVARTEVLRVQSTGEMYEVSQGRCPEDVQDLHAKGYIKRVMEDPWGKPYEVRCPGEHDRIDVVSAGPDCELGNEDDVTSWAKAEDDESHQFD